MLLAGTTTASSTRWSGTTRVNERVGGGGADGGGSEQLAVAVLDGKLYAVGGYNYDGGVLSSEGWSGTTRRRTRGRR